MMMTWWRRSALAALLLIGLGAGHAMAACIEDGAFPWPGGVDACVAAADLNSALANARGSTPPLNSYSGLGAPQGFIWQDDSTTPETLRKCAVATCTGGVYHASEWVTIGTVDTVNGVLKPGGIISTNAAAVPAALSGAMLQLAAPDGTNTRLELDGFAAASFWSCRRADNTNASPSAVLSGDELCSLNGWAYDGTAYQGPVVAIRTYAAENFASGHRGSKINFATTPVASTTLTNRFWVGNGFYADGLADEGQGTIDVTAIYLNGSALTYAPPTTGSAILKGNGSGGFSSAASGTDYAPATSGSAILKGNGSGGFSSAASGTDYAPATAGTAAQLGNGSGGFTGFGGSTACGANNFVTTIGANLATTCAAPTSVVPRSYLAGLTLSNDGSSPNTVLDIAAGVASDTTNAALISLGSFTKSTGGAWASGSGSNGMGNGLTVAASTWYYVCLANNSGTPDVWFDTSSLCANRPSGISDTKFRRIGAFKTNGSSQIIAFTQQGDLFVWAASVNDVTTTSLGTTATLETLGSVPPMSPIIALFRGYASGSGSPAVLVTSPSENSVAVSGVTGELTVSCASTNSEGCVFTLEVLVNSSGQIRAVSTAASTTLNIATYGWIDRRGRDS